MNAAAKLFLACGALSAAVAVVLGAAGAHLFVGLDGGAGDAFHTALQYHRFHALGLLAVGLLALHRPAWRGVAAAGVLMLTGTLLFCGPLYLRSLADFHVLNALTPWGGAAFVCGWLALAVAVLRR